MSRSRSFNRFHRYLARQKRRGLRTALPRFREELDVIGVPVNHSRNILRRLWGREIQLELQESDA
ncbi:MAG: hypothetical protein CBB80_003485 [Synechococcus sp. TMED20]|jgi:hypothetical protein|nr:MAG: hypothetical protein CBB80_003485 [Synechococcus sp. TMED20]